MAKLGPEMHKAGKVIFINDCIPRLEMLRQVDGIYAEWTWEGMDAYWNYSALLGLRKPVMAWTPDDTFDKKKEKPDDYLQRCLYLGVYPTAPYPLNNHCLRPSEVADAAYLDYGPLLDAMRGKKWVLEPHCVEVQDDAAKANLFETPQGYAIPVAFGGEAEIAKVVLRGLKGISDYTRVEALHPGVEKSISVVVERSGDTFVLTVPLHRGCAMVRVAKDADGT
jgi:hypothetical protein